MLLGLIVFSVWTAAAAAAASAAACIMGIRLQSETHMHSLMGDLSSSLLVVMSSFADGHVR
jgi:hypothetical protein